MNKIIVIGAFILIIFSLLFFSSDGNSSSSQINQNSPVVNEENINDPQQYEENSETQPFEENIEETSDPLEFNGYECTEDCSGHEAGYEWAQENGITQDDVDSYSGNSDSFREGMQSAVDEQ